MEAGFVRNRLSALEAGFVRIWTHLAKISILNFGHLDIFVISDFLNIFSYRADTSIPTTIVSIGVGGQKLVAYLQK